MAIHNLLPKGAYVYAIAVDGVTRYIGKGRGERYWYHFRRANRINELRQDGYKVRAFKLHNRIAKALRNGSRFQVKILQQGLSDQQGFALEIAKIAWHQVRHPGQLWNVLEGGDGWTSAGARKCQPNKRIDLTGKRIGRWRVGRWRRLDNYYFCVCSCGTKRWVGGLNLKKQLSRSCGCLQRERAASYYSNTDMAGKHFGRLVVLKRMPKRKRCLRWLCLCDCGNKVVVNGNALRSGNTKSCGCYARERRSITVSRTNKLRSKSNVAPNNVRQSRIG